MTTAPPAFPLAWPSGRPRTPAHKRKLGKFRYDGRDITTAVAVRRLETEVSRLGGQYAVLSTDIPLTMAGGHRSGVSVQDPGAVAYFTVKGQPFALACDRYTQVWMNIAALAAHVEATRAIERHGVASAVETLQAFQALPAPGAPREKPWREVMGFDPAFPGNLHIPPDEALELVGFRYRKMAKDRTDDQAGLAELNRARGDARAELAGPSAS